MRRGKQTLTLATRRVGVDTTNPRNPAGRTHDLAGDTFRKLSNDVGYIKLSSLKSADVAGYVDKANQTKGLIIDIRNYPSEFVVFTLGSLLVDKPTEFVRFTIGDLSNPGAFHWGPALSLTPEQPHYKGKAVILVDEVSQSQAQYTAMAFRSAPLGDRCRQHHGWGRRWFSDSDQRDRRVLSGQETHTASRHDSRC